MKNTPVGTTFLILTMTWLAGCSGDSVKSDWQASASTHPTYSRILIVGVSTDFTDRCTFEFAMASEFQGSSTIPIASCNTMMPKDALTRANIDHVVASTNADAVLTSAIVTMQVGMQKGNTRDTRPVPYYQVTGVGYVTGELGYYGIPVAFVQLDSTQSIPQITGEIHILTKLFDAKSATLVYSADTRAKSDDIQSTSSSIEGIAELIGDRLRHDGVIH